VSDPEWEMGRGSDSLRWMFRDLGCRYV